jgi:hypothetical protein
MALTANEISEIRLLAGDNCADSADYVVTDAQLDLWFAELGGKPCVVTRVIQARIADASKTVDIRQDGSPPRTRWSRSFKRCSTTGRVSVWKPSPQRA